MKAWEKLVPCLLGCQEDNTMKSGSKKGHCRTCSWRVVWIWGWGVDWIFFLGPEELNNIKHIYIYIYIHIFLGLPPWHKVVPRLGLNQSCSCWPESTAIETGDLSCICELLHSSQQYCVFSLKILLLFFFLGLYQWHMEIPRPGVKSEPELLAWAHSHSNVGSKLHPLPTWQLEAKLDPLTQWARPGWNMYPYGS